MTAVEHITINDLEDEDHEFETPLEIIQDYGGVSLFFVEGRGRGIMANQVYANDVVVLVAPTVLISPERKSALHQTELSAYTFKWPYPHALPDSDDVSEDWICVVLGLNSMVNHSDYPNCAWEFDKDTMQHHIYTIREIEPFEELTIDYGWSQDKKDHYGIS